MPGSASAQQYAAVERTQQHGWWQHLQQEKLRSLCMRLRAMVTRLGGQAVAFKAAASIVLPNRRSMLLPGALPLVLLGLLLLGRFSWAGCFFCPTSLWPAYHAH